MLILLQQGEGSVIAYNDSSSYPPLFALISPESSG